MKKLFFVAAAVVGLVNVNAQEKTLDPTFGVKSSLNVSSFNGKDVSNNDYKVGLSAGLYANFPLTDRMSIQPEVNFTRVGGKFKQEVADLKIDNNVTLDYITVPLMFKYYPGGSRFNVEAGPQIGFNVYASNESTVTSTLPNVLGEVKGKANIKDQVENIDFGVNFGLGYNVTENINVGVRYYMGLTKVGDRNDTNVSTVDLKNHSFVLGVGYSF